MSDLFTKVEFKIWFSRNFNFGDNEEEGEISDLRIKQAIIEAEAIYNKDLYPNKEVEKLALMYLTAHFLQNDLNAADSEGGSIGNQTSRHVGQVSEAIEIPRWMLRGEMSMFATTYYGQKFLQISMPYVGGVVYSVSGGTNN